MTDPERIYVRLPNWVGDVVLATPFLRSLRDAFPRAAIVAHGKARNFDLLDGGGFYDRAIPFEKRWKLVEPFVEGRRVRRLAGPFDLAILCTNSTSSAFCAWAAGAPRRIGYALDGRSLLLTDAIAVAKDEKGLRPIPMVDYYHGLLAPLGKPPTAARRPVLPITDAARARAAAFFARVGVAEGERVFALNAGAVWETKRWPTDYLGRLADGAAERGARPLVLGGPGEEWIGREAQKVARAKLLGIGEVVPLGDLCAVLARCELFVTTDSGPRHVGVAARIPVVTLIGSTHPAYTEVDWPLLETCCERVECWPCHLERCPIDHRCMARLTPEKVLAACDRVLARARADAGGPRAAGSG